jgi:radical SAM protein with 4Fe4S-binding SPASM domain
MEEFAGKFMGPPGVNLFRCGAGKGLCIDAYGFAQPCMGVRAPELTFNLRSLSLRGKSGHCERSEAISQALDFFKSLKELRATNPEYLRRCAVCFLKGLCEQCPAKSWAEHGTLDTPVEYLCAVTHAQARFLGWLKDGEKAWEIHYSRSRLVR